MFTIPVGLDNKLIPVKRTRTSRSLEATVSGNEVFPFFFFFWSAKSITSISSSNKDTSTGKQSIFYRCKLPWEDSHQTFSIYGATACCFPEAVFCHSFSLEPLWVQIPAQSLPSYVNLCKLHKNFVPQLLHL